MLRFANPNPNPSPVLGLVKTVCIQMPLVEASRKVRWKDQQTLGQLL